MAPQSPTTSGKTKPPAALRYTVELLASDGGVDRVLARAHSIAVARAVFSACAEEYPGRALTLRDGRREIARSRAHKAS